MRADDEPRTGDLFASAAPSAVPPLAATPPALAEPPVGRPVLDAASRTRLSEVLDDLECTKAQIDALLRA